MDLVNEIDELEKVMVEELMLLGWKPCSTAD